MNRKTALLFALIVLAAAPLFAQDWAKKMFKVSEHDFGTCAKNAMTEYSFELENLYMEDVHIVGVRTSCGCTTPKVQNDTLKTYEKGAIIAHFNTDKFQGQRGATLTVTIDKPFYAEVQLHVKGTIRGDVSIEPGSVKLGSVDQGKAVDQTVSINSSSQTGWKITDVKSSNPHIKASVAETRRYYNQVTYDLKVHVDENAPQGYINDHLILVTNDSQNTQIPVLVEGRVDSGISVSPTALFMGVMEPGQKVTKQLIVKCKKPLKIKGIDCDDKSFEFKLPDESVAKTLHVIPVTFMAGTDVGKVVKTIKIETEEGNFSPELMAYAVVAAK